MSNRTDAKRLLKHYLTYSHEQLKEWDCQQEIEAIVDMIIAAVHDNLKCDCSQHNWDFDVVSNLYRCRGCNRLHFISELSPSEQAAHRCHHGQR